MRIWMPLLLAPTLALADQVVAFAALGWACAHDRAIVIHAIHALFLLATAVTLVPWWRARNASRGRADAAARRQHFLANLALATAALSMLAIAAMWLTTWVISPCVA
jgi:hypothetical protein